VWMSSSCLSPETSRTRSCHVKKLKHSLWRGIELSRTDPELARAAAVPSSVRPRSAILQTRRGLRLELFAGQLLQKEAGSRAVRQERLVCSGVIGLEDSSGLASFSAWTLLDKMNDSFLALLHRLQVRLKGSSSKGWLCLHLQSFVFADSVLSWNTAHEAFLYFVRGGPQGSKPASETPANTHLGALGSVEWTALLEFWRAEVVRS